jgi:hypothetical protein
MTRPVGSLLAAQIRNLRPDGDPLDVARDVVSALPPNLTGADLSTIGSGGLLKEVERRCREADEAERKSTDQVALPHVSRIGRMGRRSTCSHRNSR